MRSRPRDRISGLGQDPADSRRAAVRSPCPEFSFRAARALRDQAPARGSETTFGTRRTNRSRLETVGDGSHEPQPGPDLEIGRDAQVCGTPCRTRARTAVRVDRRATSPADGRRHGALRRAPDAVRRREFEPQRRSEGRRTGVQLPHRAPDPDAIRLQGTAPAGASSGLCLLGPKSVAGRARRCRSADPERRGHRPGGPPGSWHA